jgi:hypothetical protein
MMRAGLDCPAPLLTKSDVLSVCSARKAFVKIRASLERVDLIRPSLNAGTDLITAAEYHRAKGRNGTLFSIKFINDGLALEIGRTDTGGSVITRHAIKMSDQLVNAAEMLDKTTELFKNSLATFEKVSGAALAQSKQRVSQLSDYNVRLATSLANLNKTMGDDGLHKTLEAAERMVAALERLDELEKSGRLGKIMAALQS